MAKEVLKPVEWVGSSKADLKKFPAAVQDEVGSGPGRTQTPRCQIAQGIGCPCPEVVSHHDGDTYRTVYTVRFKAALYVLHAFQKKAKQGIATPKQEIDLVKHRLKAAEQHYTDTYGKG